MRVHFVGLIGVEVNADPNIKSDRNGVILGWRNEGYTPPSPPTLPMFIFGEMWATKYGEENAELSEAEGDERRQKKQERRIAKKEGAGAGVSLARPSRMARRPPQHPA